MPRRFKDAPNPQKARTDWKREQEAREPRRSPARGGGGLAALMSRMRGGGPGPMRGGPGPGGGGLDAMRNHPAVNFGRQMTGGVADGPSASIRNLVMQRLAQRGIGQDATGTWQIAGLNRPQDPGLAIRNSALAAMDPSGEMLRRVMQVSPMPGAIRGMPSGMGGVPSPGLGAGSLPIGPQNGMPLPPVTGGVRPPDLTRVPTPPGGGTQSVPPGLPGGPPRVSNVPGAGGPVPSPGLGGIPAMPAPKPPTTTGGINPTMVPGAQTRHTVPSMPTVPPGGGSPAGFPTMLPPSAPKPAPQSMPTAGVAGGLNQSAPPPLSGGASAPWPRTTTSIQPTSDMIPAGLGGTGDVRPGHGVPIEQQVATLAKQFPPPGAPPSGSMPPPSVANDIYRQPGTPPPQLTGASAPWVQNNQPKPPQGPPPVVTPIYGSGTPQNMPPGSEQPIVRYANPNAGLVQRLQQGRPGTPPAPGRAPTPMVPPGAMPGRSTPFNPMQMAQPAAQLPPVPRPGNFGTPGQTTIPQRQPVSLPNLGQSIQQTVQSRIGAANQGVRPGVSPATPGSPVGNSLDDLGDRIRAAVAGNQGNVQPAAPAGGVGNLGPATQSIMDRVRAQIAQAGVGPGGMPQAPQLPPMTNGTTPFPTQNTSMTPGGAPSTGTMPGAAPIPPGGVPASNMAAPSTTTAPSGGIGAPTGTINCQFGYGCGGDWSSVNQYDATFAAEGAKWGVDPAMLKAMAVIESGGQMIQGPAGAYGVMQIKGMNGDGSTWGNLADQLGYDLSTPEGQIGVAAAILGQYGEGSNPQERFLNSYYPTDCYTCPPPDQNNGITQEVYWNNMQGLINDINAAGGGATQATPGATPTGQLPPGANTPIQGGGPMAGEPGTMDPPAIPGTAVTPADTSLIPGMDAPRGGDVPPPTQGPEVPVVMPPTSPGGGFNNTIAQPSGTMAPNGQPIGTDDLQARVWADAIVPGGAANSEYGFGDDQGINMYCNYRDWSCTQHTGLDIGTGGVSAPAYSTGAGQVICYGEQSAANNPGVGCGAYTDSGGGLDGGYVDANGNVHNSGNISVLMPSGAVIIYGHMRSSNYGLGEQVPAGAQIGMSGDNNGYHVHAEVQLPIGVNGEYQLVDPNLYYANYYCTAEYNGGRGFCAQ